MIPIRGITLRICRHKAIYRGAYTTGDWDPEYKVWLVAGISDGRHVGYGEARARADEPVPPPWHIRRVSIDEWAELQALARPLVGRDARRLSQLIPEDPSCDEGNSIRDVLDFALHDLVGRAVGVPAATLLGGIGRRRVRSSYVVHTGAPDEMAALAADMHGRFGINTFKLKPIGTLEGAGHGDAAPDAGEDPRRAGTGLRRRQLRALDHRSGQGRGLPERAVPLGLEVYEDPIDADFATYRSIRERTPVQLMLDDKARTPQAVMEILREKAADQSTSTPTGRAASRPACARRPAALGGTPTRSARPTTWGRAWRPTRSCPPSCPSMRHVNSTLTICSARASPSCASRSRLRRETTRCLTGRGLGVEVDEAKLEAITEKKADVGVTTTPLIGGVHPRKNTVFAGR